MLKLTAGFVLNTIRLIYGIAYFYIKKENLSVAHHAMIRLFCYTRGYSNHFLSWLLSKVSPAISTDGELWESKYTVEQIKKLTQELEKNGFVVLEQKLPEHILQAFKHYTKEAKCKLRLLDYQVKQNVTTVTEAQYNSNDLRAVRYEYSMANLLKQNFVQEILAQTLFLSVAKEYLKTNPILDIVECWWHTSYGGVPDENAAQKYHFDMDRLKWLKVFVYLTDVAEENGPHCFVKGSHRPGKIPWSFLRQGYARIDDEDVFSYFDKVDEVEFHGRAGTIILEDTRGLHKGKHVYGGDRLMLELQYSNSLFGAPLSFKDEQRVTIPQRLKAIPLTRTYEYLYKDN